MVALRVREEVVAKWLGLPTKNHRESHYRGTMLLGAKANPNFPKSIVLASGSPRRKEILGELLHLQFGIVKSTFAEDLDKVRLLVALHCAVCCLCLTATFSFSCSSLTFFYCCMCCCLHARGTHCPYLSHSLPVTGITPPALTNAAPSLRTLPALLLPEHATPSTLLARLG